MVDTHQQNTALGIVIAFPILGGLAVLLRLWSRQLSRSALSSGMHGPEPLSTPLIDSLLTSLLR
jgi:hypothetical protein